MAPGNSSSPGVAEMEDKQIKMTLMDLQHTASEDTTDDNRYECYLSAPDEGATVVSRRLGNTRSSGNNPAPPVAVKQPGDSFWRVTFWNQNSQNKAAFGVFGCDASTSGKTATVVPTLRMRSDPVITPSDGLFTQTVNVGDEGISIRMTKMTQIADKGDIDWRHDTVHNEVFRNKLEYTITGPIKTTDAGIYECYIDKTRDDAEHALHLLIVRACPAYRWGPPNCLGVCDNCYNGGVCDDSNGKCICLAGFNGTNCQRACGGANSFGDDCTAGCSSDSRAVDSCKRRLFCRPDPAGCRCITGFEGLACNKACTAGSFGASCLQTCSCASGEPCDPYSGTCPNGCSLGWTGDSCQECQGAKFGVDCTQACHCEERSCHQLSGLCSGDCGSQWVDLFPPYTCQTGLTNVSFTKVNPGVTVIVKCHAVEGPGGNIDSLDFVLSRQNPVLSDTDITDTGDETNGDSTVKEFSVDGTDDGDTLYCQLREDTNLKAVLSVDINFYVLPGLEIPPSEKNATDSTVTITWTAWNSNTDEGDPSVIGYVPYHKKVSETEWAAGNKGIITVLEFTFTGLGPETTYSFSVAAVREGEGGEGPKSPSTDVTTICADPGTDVMPSDVHASYTGLHQELANITWKISEEDVACSTGVEYFTIYHSGATRLASHDVVVNDADARWHVIEDLEPGQSYTFQVTLTTLGGESEAGEVGEPLQMPKLPSLSSEPVIYNYTCSSVVIQWRSWNVDDDEGTPPIVGYIPYYKLHNSDTWNKSDAVAHTPETEELSHTFGDLAESTNYSFSISAVRNGPGGEGAKGREIYRETESCGEPDPGLSAAVIAVSIVIPIVLIVLIAVLTVMYRRRVYAKKSDPYRATMSTPAVAIGSSVRTNSYANEAMPSETTEETPVASTAVYTNVERPGPIAVTELERYIRKHESGNVSPLEQQFQLLDGGKMFPSDIAEKEENKKKNRFRNMVAYDHSRVKISAIEGDPYSDYYNANYIKDYEGNYVFIACQGPNTASVEDFWRMICQENVTNIVMLTNLIEKGKDRCLQYWPASLEKTHLFGNTLVYWRSTVKYAEYEIRELEICPRGEEARTVLNWHFQTWPDMDTPDQPTALMAFTKSVKIAQRASTGPLTVHCSAGIGRTGTFIALCTLMNVLQAEDMVDIYGYVEKMREDRIRMVQTAKQFHFLHHCLLEFYISGNTEIPAIEIPSFDCAGSRGILTKEFKLLAKLDDLVRFNQNVTAENPSKCRFSSLVPVEKKRPILQCQGKSNKTTFINACFTSSYRKFNAFLATQSPMQNTVEDFWRLVFDRKCPLIVMLNELDESCCQYWPDIGTTTYGNLTVTLKEERDLTFYHYRLFDLKHAHSQKILAVHHMQLMSWNNVCPTDTLRLIKSMEKLQYDYSMNEPIVVHCIDGAGRTGVFLTVVSEMDRIKTEEKADVFNSVRKLRESSRHLVLTEEDYILCHTLLEMDQPEPEYGNI